MKGKKYLGAVVKVAMFLTALILFFNASFITNFDIPQNINYLDGPSYATVGSDGTQYIINKSTTQILVLNEDNTFKMTLNGGTSILGDNFNFVNNLAVDEEGNIYVSDVSYNSNYDKDSGFRILKYSSDGKSLGSIYEREYENDKMLYIHSSCMAMEYNNGRIYFAQREFDEIVLYSVSANQKNDDAVIEHIYPYENAGLLVFDIAIDRNKDVIYFTDKKGNIYTQSSADPELLYDGGNYCEDIDFYEVPNGVTVSKNSEKLYYTDIGRREIFEIDLETNEKKCIYERNYEEPLDCCELFYRIGYNHSTDEGFIVCSSGDVSVFGVYDGSNMKTDTEFTFESSTVISYFVLLVLAIVFVIIAVVYGFRVFSKAVKGENGESFIMYALVFVSILVIFSFTAKTILDSTSQRYRERVIINTYYLSQIVAQLIDGDVLERIEEPDDYMSDDYQIVRNQLHEAFAELPTNMESLSEDTDNTTYCVLYRMKNNVVYYTMHLSDDDGVIYPDEYTYEDSDYKLVYDTGEAQSFDNITTSDGTWLFTVSPILNSNKEMVALCEVGINLVSYDEANFNVICRILVYVGSLTVVIFLLLSELVNLIEVLKKWDKHRLENTDNELLVDFVRLFAFLIFMADNFTCVIIPLMSEELYSSSSVIPENIAIALPLSAQALAAAITGFAAGHVINRIGNRKSFIAGIVFHIIGLTLCGLSSSLVFFALAMLVVGIGMGMNVVCMNTFIVNRNDDGDSEHTSGFSMYTVGTFCGTNCGIVIGTIASERMGYNSVFFISAVVAVVVLIAVLHYYKKEIHFHGENGGTSTEINILKFITDFKIAAYFIFALLPYVIFASFVFYFVPLYAESQGMSESNIGLITLVYGLAVSYLSGFSTKHIVEKFGAGISVVIASIITAASLIVFILSPSIVSLVFVVLIMGFADSFGYPALSVYFSENKTVKAYGESKAMGIYNVFDGLAGTIAPILFGMALILGYAGGMIVMGGGFAVCAVLFLISVLKKEHR